MWTLEGAGGVGRYGLLLLLLGRGSVGGCVDAVALGEGWWSGLLLLLLELLEGFALLFAVDLLQAFGFAVDVLLALALLARFLFEHFLHAFGFLGVETLLFGGFALDLFLKACGFGVEFPLRSGISGRGAGIAWGRVCDVDRWWRARLFTRASTGMKRWKDSSGGGGLVVAEVKCLAQVAVIDFSDDDGAEEEDNFETLVIFHFHSGEIRLVDGDLFEVPEESKGDVGFSVLALATIWVCRLLRERAYVVFRQLAVFLPFEP